MSIKQFLIKVFFLVSFSAHALNYGSAYQSNQDVENHAASGGKVANGGDGMVISEPSFLFLRNNRLELLDLSEINGGHVGSVFASRYLFIDVRKNFNEYSFLDNICDQLKMHEVVCNGLKNKFSQIKSYLPQYFIILKEAAKDMTWTLKDKISEVDDESDFCLENCKYSVEKIQIAVRIGNHVKIKKKGWKYYHKINKPFDSMNKIALILHEIIYKITEAQGDINSKKARKVNGFLFLSPSYKKIHESYELLTKKKVNIKKIKISPRDLFIIAHDHFQKWIFFNGTFCSEMSCEKDPEAFGWTTLRNILIPIKEQLWYRGEEFENILWPISKYKENSTAKKRRENLIYVYSNIMCLNKYEFAKYFELQATVFID